jgi:hypothetical protein
MCITDMSPHVCVEAGTSRLRHQQAAGGCCEARGASVMGLGGGGAPHVHRAHGRAVVQSRGPCVLVSELLEDVKRLLHLVSTQRQVHPRLHPTHPHVMRSVRIGRRV